MRTIADSRIHSLAKWCNSGEGVFYRLHGLDPRLKKPWPPVYFSRDGRTRFDPTAGPGTFYVGETLAGVLMEVFDDMWGPVNSVTRSLTRKQLREWWVTLVAVSMSRVFDARGANLSKIGTDSQLLEGDHALSREWALRLAKHPLRIDGIYPSRHDAARCNFAIFKKLQWLRTRRDAKLIPPAINHGGRTINPMGPLRYGPPVQLKDHPELKAALIELDVAMLP
jgi:RES domain